MPGTGRGEPRRGGASGRMRRACDRAAAALLSLSLSLLLPLAAAAPVNAQGAAAPRPPNLEAEDDELESLLQRLGLADLQAAHLERLAGTLQGAEQLTVAQRLADLYAGLLLARSDDPASYQQVADRMDALLQRIPQAATASLQAMRLQADFQQAEKLALRWLTQRDDGARVESLPLLDRIAPRLAQLHGELSQKAAAVEKQLGAPDVPRRAEQRLEKQLDDVNGVLLRATFLSGWSSYYLGVLAKREDSLRQARRMFRELLELDEAQAELAADWLGLEAPGRARAMIGLGLCEAAAGDLAASKKCFALLQDPAVPRELRDQASQWQVQGWLAAGQLAEARTVAAQLVGALRPATATPGQVGLCATLIEFGYRPGGDPELGALGVRGLAQLHEFKALLQLLEKHRVTLDDPVGFWLRWVRGQQLLSIAESSGDAADYRAAGAMLASSLKEADAAEHIDAEARCRCADAWCLYHQGEFVRSAEQYQRAAEGLAASRLEEEAGNALWMASIAWRKAADRQPTRTADARRALEQLRRDYPQHSRADSALYQLIKLQADGGELEKLREIPPGSPHYLDAQFDLCILAHQQWLEQKGQPGERDAAAKAVEAAAGLMRLDEAGNPPTRRLKAALLGAAAALESPQPDAAAAAGLLRAVSPPAPTEPLAAEYHYRGAAVAAAQRQTAKALEHARWIRQHAAGSPFESPALVLAARAADEAARSLNGAASLGERQLAWTEARDAYQQLVAVLGSSDAALGASRNAQVALYRMAEFQLQLGQAREAAAAMQRLVKISPKSRPYVLGLARALFQARDYEAALPHWRSLLRGKAGDDLWFEAKLHQLECLHRVDPSQARIAWQQFQALYPNPAEPWREPFQQLGAKIAE